jgi:putative addiction module component (TIGR02574 family)
VTTREVLEAALALPPEERVHLIAELEASLPDAQVELEPALLAEINARIARARAGEPGIPADEVFAEARRRR